MRLPTRILIKFSGELLSSSQDTIYSADALQKVVSSLADLAHYGIEYGIVIGAGNIFRGNRSTDYKISQITGDQIGMLGTIMNALMLQEVLLQANIPAHIMAPQPTIPSILPLNTDLANTFLSTKEPIIFAGGTGSPFFTTDSAATLRALEIHASLLIKATKVPGVFDKDPLKHEDAKRFQTVSYQEALQNQYQVMDSAAFALAMQYKLPIFVYKFGDPLSIVEALKNPESGTYVN